MKFKSSSDKKQYYRNQALKGGSLGIKRFVASRRQKGYGIISTLAKRFAYPLIKIIGREALEGGTDILKEIIPGANLAKQSLKKKAVSTLRNLGDKLEQSGLGRKKKKTKKRIISPLKSIKGGRRAKTKKQTSKRLIQRDIFKSF